MVVVWFLSCVLFIVPALSKMWAVSASGQFAKPQTSPTKICKHDLGYHHFGKLQSHHLKLLQSGLLMEVQHFRNAKDLQATAILFLA